VRVVGVIGPNGAGKTTLFNVICGFVRADAGSVRFGETVLDGVARTSSPGSGSPARCRASACSAG
jgi:ABC-type branched-subunit amino acid transport system ATPase component